MTPEAKFREWLKKNLDKDWFVQTIENTTQNGIPDMNVLVPNVGEVWIELKAYKSYLKKWQLSWIKKRQKKNGAVMVIVQKSNGYDIYYNDFLSELLPSGHIKIKSEPTKTAQNIREIEQQIIACIRQNQLNIETDNQLMTELDE